MSQTDNFGISRFFIYKKASVNMLMSGTKIFFYCIFVYNGVNSPLFCDLVKFSTLTPIRQDPGQKSSV